MSVFVVDVEADGPAPGLYSMVSFAAVRLQEPPLDCAFVGRVRPTCDLYIPEALAVCGVSREQHWTFEAPEQVMPCFAQWLAEHSAGRPVFVSDNPAFDWQFINHYLWRYTGGNPFGHSARRIGDFYSGLARDFFAASKWKRLRRTAHTHDPLDDARGNAEALLAMAREHGVRLPLHPKSAAQ